MPILHALSTLLPAAFKAGGQFQIQFPPREASPWKQTVGFVRLSRIACSTMFPGR